MTEDRRSECAAACVVAIGPSDNGRTNGHCRVKRAQCTRRADNREIGIDVCNPLSSNYVRYVGGIPFGRPAFVRRKNWKTEILCSGKKWSMWIKRARGHNGHAAPSAAAAAAVHEGFGPKDVRTVNEYCYLIWSVVYTIFFPVTCTHTPSLSSASHNEFHVRLTVIVLFSPRRFYTETIHDTATRPEYNAGFFGPASWWQYYAIPWSK